MDNPYIVYVKPDDSGYIIDVNSSAFLSSTEGWLEIDSGYGDKYHHAKGNYFQEYIITNGGAYRYKLMNGKVIECTADEINAQEEAKKPIVMPTEQEDTDAMLIDHEYRLTLLELFVDVVA